MRLALLLSLSLILAGCASSNAAGAAASPDRTYAASLDTAVEAVQQAIAQTRAAVADYERGPDEYVLFGRVENAVMRSGGLGYPELTSFTVRVNREGPGQARVVLRVEPAAGYGGGQAGEAYARAFFEALEGRGLVRVPR